MIKGLHRDCEIKGVAHREILHRPVHISMDTIYAIAEQAAQKSQTCIQHLYVGGAANDEKRCDVLLEKEKTHQAEISAKVHIAELDHEFRMEEMRLKHGGVASQECRREPEIERDAFESQGGSTKVETPQPPAQVPEVSEECSRPLACTPEIPQPLPRAPEIAEESCQPLARDPEVVESAPAEDSPRATVENFIAAGCEVGPGLEVYGTDFRHRLLKMVKAGQRHHFGVRSVHAIMIALKFIGKKLPSRQFKRGDMGFVGLRLKELRLD
jgi:hypothetical protein